MGSTNRIKEGARCRCCRAGCCPERAWGSPRCPGGSCGPCGRLERRRLAGDHGSDRAR
ncbi:unnamed protein product [Ectocarpus sp. 6 AP-2014]